MVTVQEIEKAISSLPVEELSKFREWFEGFDAQLWDLQLEEDATSGKLDRVADKALADSKAGKFT